MTTIVPGSAETTPFVSSLFNVEFSNVASGVFTEVSGLSIDIEEVESVIVNASGQEVTRWTPGTVKYSEITLKREFTGNREFWDWHMQMVEGDEAYSDGSIVIYNLGGKEVSRWNVNRAWPSKWSCSDLDAGSGDAMIEEITLQIEFLERQK
ncbi:MAG: phage tail protein [Ilumatobacter sp.]|uniref:phage tail protein n=1 Tax=Ilumatobacter sp. TaxID=1967498 RepID=UPI00391A169F